MRNEVRFRMGLRLGAALILVVVLATACGDDRSLRTEEPTPANIDPFSQKTSSTWVQTAVEVGRRLFTEYLRSFISLTPGGKSLKDFKVLDATLNRVQESDSGIFVRVRYSVLPFYNNDRETNYWGAGNGTVREDGWIVNKAAVILLELEEGAWAFKGMGTGP